ncbi:hypothetical protein [Catenulispora pinisilvae]|uniref:hypothetical protein n=1 Tax=Catenulispora pinisilvae TaxID=2705253 RepID=UPI0018925144|nr:hypothetical protein [Catenulispora pinisilvae]
MFDDDRVTGLLSALSPRQCAVVATRAARRVAVVADLPGADAYFDDYAPGYALLVSDASALLADCAAAAAIDSAGVAVMRQRLEALLGPEGEEEEEPGEIVADLLFNAASILNLVLRSWAEPERSRHWAFTTLSECYAFAHQLDHTRLGVLEEDPLDLDINSLILAKVRTIADAADAAPRRHVYANGYVAPVRVMMYRDALATKGMPAHTLLFHAAEPDRDGPQTADSQRLLTIGTGGPRDRTGRFRIDCDSGWVYFVDGTASGALRVSGMPSAFADLLEAFDRVVADSAVEAGPATAERLMASVNKIDPTVERIDPAFWTGLATAVASGAYAQS